MLEGLLNMLYANTWKASTDVSPSECWIFWPHHYEKSSLCNWVIIEHFINEYKIPFTFQGQVFYLLIGNTLFAPIDST